MGLVSAIVPTKDGRLIAGGTVGADDDDDPSGSVQIFDLPSGEAQKTYPVVVSAISPDGRWMSSFDNNGIYHPVLWDLKDGKRLHDLTPKNASRIIFRPDGEEVAVTHGDSEAIDLLSTSSGQIIKSLPGGGYGLGTAAYSPDGKLLAAGSYSFGTIKVWDLASMKERVTLYGQSPVQLHLVSGEESHILWGSGLAMAVSPDGKWLAQPADGRVPSGAVDIWDAATGQKLQNIPAHRLALIKLSFSRDGRWLVTVGQDNNPMMVQGQPGVMIGYPRVSVWDTATWKLQFSLEFPSGGAPGVDTSADGRLLAVSKGGGATQLFDLEKKKPIAALASPDAWPGNLAISPDGTVVVQGAREGIRLWKLPATGTGSN